MNLIATQESWKRLAEILQTESDSAGPIRIFPADAKRLSLLAAIGHPEVGATLEHVQRGQSIHDALSGLLGQLGIFESISRCPILAITGLLNAGKSSLLATYLSPANRPRVLRGMGNSAGTHRFVLWLPEVWSEDAELLNTLISFLSGLFGHAPESLSADPDEAALQYNGRVFPTARLQSSVSSPAASPADGASANASPTAANEPLPTNIDPLNIPLIAYDAALDELKIGLVDCPDIQTGFLTSGLSHSHGQKLAAERRQQLGKIGRLCSAFIIVAKLNSLHDDGLLQILSTLRDAMPGVPRMLAINKVKARYAPDVVAEQSRALTDRFGLSAVFAAYDYRSSLAHSRVPQPPPRMQPSLNNEPQPIFFEAIAPNRPSASTPVAPLRYLYDLGERLDAGTLSRESSRSLRLQLKVKAAEALLWLEKNEQLYDRQLSDAWQSVADACYEFMAERDSSGRAVGLRLQASPAIVAQMADSLQRTAPAWMKISLSIDRTARQLHQAIASSTSRFKILQSASASVTQFTKRFRRGEGAQVVTPERLADAIRNCDIHDALQRTPQANLIAGCEVAMKRFADEDKTTLNQEELDQWSKQVWSGMSLKAKLWKGTQPLAVVLAPLLAAVLVPIDGGGTAVLVFASAKELLAAAGIAAVMTPMATGGETLSIVQRETPWRQLSDLFAIVCDSIGLPRPPRERLPSSRCDGVPRKLLGCSLESQNSAQPAVFRWQLDNAQMTELQLRIQQLD